MAGGLGEGRPVECSQPVQRPQGVEATEIRFTLASQSCQGWHGGGEVAVDEEPLGGVAPPAVGVVQLTDESVGIQLGKRRRLVGDRPIRRHDAPDATEVVAGEKVARFYLIGDPRGQEDDVFDHALVHIGDVERAIRPGARVDGAETFVGGGEEFLSGGIVALGLWGQAISQDETPDEMPAGFRNEQVAACIGGKLVAPVDAGAGDDGVSAQGAVVAQFQSAKRDLRCRADGEDFLRRAGNLSTNSELHPVPALARKRQEPRMAACIFLRHVIHHGGRALVTSVEAPDIVEAHPELAAVDRLFLDELAVAKPVPPRPIGVV